MVGIVFIELDSLPSLVTKVTVSFGSFGLGCSKDHLCNCPAGYRANLVLVPADGLLGDWGSLGLALVR